MSTKLDFHYDYLIVGAGLFGAVFAHESTKAGKKCLVIDRRNHLGGNTYCERHEDINVHKYGAHIFHTNSKIIWDYVSQFATFNNYINSPLAIVDGEVYNLPFNMNTFNRLWGITTPQQAQEIIIQQRLDSGIVNPKNLEEQCIFLVGHDIYHKLIRGYTLKQWGTDPKNLPSSIIKRLPIRFTYNNNYYNDRYQGIPEGGYNPIIEKLLKGSSVSIKTNFFEDRDRFKNLARRIVFTGQIDEYFEYCFGTLDYRSLEFRTKTLDIENFQGNAVVNYPSENISYTRIIEHKFFEFVDSPKTVISYEYPTSHSKFNEPFYPINDKRNTAKYQEYKDLSKREKNVIFGGRLAEYKYYDMHQVIASALKAFEMESNQ